MSPDTATAQLPKQSSLVCLVRVYFLLRHLDICCSWLFPGFLVAGLLLRLVANISFHTFENKKLKASCPFRQLFKHCLNLQ